MRKLAGNSVPSQSNSTHMSVFLNIPEATLREKKGYWTAREISQQPTMWKEAAAIVEKARPELDAWLSPILSKQGVRIILTGAGTSAYAGEALAPHMRKCLGKNVEAISTTDIVSNPQNYLIEDTPTILVSYARSGNSPESVAAYKLTDQLVKECYHLVITCNKDSELSRHAATSPNGFSLLMPEATLDQSFAMTSSFTSMMLATLCVFTPDEKQMSRSIAATSYLLDTELPQLEEQAETSFDRIVFLGCGSLLGIATEARLKMLELTAGKIDCYAESPLGFRHGPKFTINGKTMVIFLNSTQPYSRQYDDDLIKELVRDRQTAHIYSLGDYTAMAEKISDDVWLSFPYITLCQILSFYKAMALGITPDNPSPSGEVNRVVQGVTIYPYET